jgi:hypothetical protein
MSKVESPLASGVESVLGNQRDVGSEGVPPHLPAPLKHTTAELLVNGTNLISVERLHVIAHVLEQSLHVIVLHAKYPAPLVTGGSLFLARHIFVSLRNALQ